MNLKKRLTTLLYEVNYDFKYFTMEGFVQHVEGLKKRKLHFAEWDLPPDLFGAWITDAEEPVEYIFFARNLPPILRTHVQLHEMSHFLCGHPTYQFGRDNSGNKALPLFRSNFYTNKMEVEAETLAALIQTQVFRYSLQQELSISISSHQTTTEFLTSMGLV